jgi:hypothetical protein
MVSTPLTAIRLDPLFFGVQVAIDLSSEERYVADISNRAGPSLEIFVGELWYNVVETAVILRRDTVVVIGN